MYFTTVQIHLYIHSSKVFMFVMFVINLSKFFITDFTEECLYYVSIYTRKLKHRVDLTCSVDVDTNKKYFTQSSHHDPKKLIRLILLLH